MGGSRLKHHLNHLANHMKAHIKAQLSCLLKGSYISRSFYESGKGLCRYSQLDVWSLGACVWWVSEREDKRALRTL